MCDAYQLLTRVRDTKPDDYRRLVASVNDATPCIPLDVLVAVLKERTLCHHHHLIDCTVQRGVAAKTMHVSMAAVMCHIHGATGAADMIESLREMSVPLDMLKAANTTLRRWNRLDGGHGGAEDAL